MSGEMKESLDDKGLIDVSQKMSGSEEEAQCKTKEGIFFESKDAFHEKDQSRWEKAWKKFLDIVTVQEKGNLSTAQMFLYNHDLRPVERDRRTWSWYNFVFFWVADSFNVNTWQIAATGVQAGMTWWQTWLSVWLGYAMTGVFVTLAARVGTYYHVSFPVSCRASFGIFGSLWPIINRVVMACIWYSVQAWIGGQCVQLMLLSIFGNNLNTKIPDGITSPNATTFQFLGFFLFWLFSLPAIYLHPHQVRHLFTVKAYIVPVAGIGFLIWTLVKAHGIGPVVHQDTQLHGSELGWAFVDSTMNSLANFATLIVNAPDFSRFADTKNAAVWSQLIGIPVCFSVTALIGILVSSASGSLYGVTYWSPLDVMGRFLDHYSSGNRAGVFFISFAFALAQLGTNISANSLSFGTDCTAMLPRYINIRRGGFLCAAIALCICPWNLMSSSNKFTTYLSAYSVFLSSIAGVVASDYFFIRRGYMRVSQLYSHEASNYYSYNKFGVNWRGYAAYIAGILPNIVGFVGATGTHVVPKGATYLYKLNFFAGFITAFVIYALLCMISPVPGRPMTGFFQRGWFEEWQEVEEFDDIQRGGLVEIADDKFYFDA